MDLRTSAPIAEKFQAIAHYSRVDGWLATTTFDTQQTLLKLQPTTLGITLLRFVDNGQRPVGIIKA